MKKVSDIFRKLSDERLRKDLESSSGLFFVGYSGVASADLTVLRRDLGSFGSRMFVTKNSFMNVVLKKAEKDKSKDILGFIDGPTALVFIDDDPIGPAKVLTNFVKSHDTMKLRGGYIRDRLLQEQDFRMLASIPSREILLHQLAFTLNGPLTKFAMSLNQIILKLCYALKAIGENKEKK